MNSHPLEDVVLAELGDKVPAAVAESVAAARDDLSRYRDLQPAWVAEHSERGLANWIHDRVWAHLMQRLDGEAEISSYPTQTALQFYMQGPQPLFPEMEEVRLAAGYLWDGESRSVGDAVISMRDGMDNVVWSVVIDVDPGTGAVAIRPMPSGPTPPVIDVSGEAGDEGQADQAP